MMITLLEYKLSALTRSYHCLKWTPDNFSQKITGRDVHLTFSHHILLTWFSFTSFIYVAKHNVL